MSTPKKKGEKKSAFPIRFSTPLEVRQTGVSSVELKRDSKGATIVTVKSYDEDVIMAMKSAVKQFDTLCKKYPDVT